MKIFLFLGSRRGFACLKKFIALNANICGILCLMEDSHEDQYHKKITPLAEENQIPIFYSHEIKPNNYSTILLRCQPDIAFAIGWRFIIPQKAYTIPAKGTLIIHDSLLPKYRGFAPMNWAIINGETKTGVSLFFIAEGIDCGPIVDQLETEISLTDTAQSVDEKIIMLYEKIIEKNLPRLQTGQYQAIEQNETEATYTCKRIPEDGLINWQHSAQQIHNLVRATSEPFPGAFTYWRGKRMIIWQTALPKKQLIYSGAIPGRILGKKNGYIEVLTADGVLQIQRLQLDGEEKMNAADFVISVKDTFGG
jgi:methionyl-tRNA formyltransferase